MESKQGHKDLKPKNRKLVEKIQVEILVWAKNKKTIQFNLIQTVFFNIYAEIFD